MNDKKLIEKLESLPLDFWDFKEEDTKKFTHGIHSYPAVMVSPISRNIIKIVKEIMNVETLYDPFMGSGSVLIESILNGVNKTYGTDLNPLALLLSKVRTTPLNISQINWLQNEYIDIIKCAFEKYGNLPLELHHFIVNDKQLDITDKKGWGENADIFLEEFKSKHNIDIEFPKFKNIGFWFKPNYITNSRTILSISGSSNCYIELIINSNNQVELGIKDSNGTYQTVKTFSFSVNMTWNFISLSYKTTYSSNKTSFCIFINGEVQTVSLNKAISISSKLYNVANTLDGYVAGIVANGSSLEFSKYCLLIK